MIRAVYLSTELHQQLGSVRTVRSQAAYCCTEVGQARYGFASLGGPTGSFSMAGACCRTGGKPSSASCCQAHQSDQSSDVSQTKRLQTCCKAAARATVWKKKEGWRSQKVSRRKVRSNVSVLYRIRFYLWWCWPTTPG